TRKRWVDLVQHHVQHGLPCQATVERLGGGERTVLGELVDRGPSAAEAEIGAGLAAPLYSAFNVLAKRGKAPRGKNRIERVDTNVAEREVAVLFVCETKELGRKGADVSLPVDRDDRERRGLLCPHRGARLGGEDGPGHRLLLADPE